MNSKLDQISILTSADKSRWNEIYDQLPARLQDIHFTFDYNFLYEKNGDGEIRLFVFQRNEQIYFYPFLLREIVLNGSKTDYKDIETVYGYTGPISSTDDFEFLKEADLAFSDYCKSENVITEFIRFNPLLQNQKIAEWNPSVKLIALRDYVVIDLKMSEEELFSSYDSTNRNKIRKSQKAGVQIELDHTCNSFSNFKNIYLENMKRINTSKMYFFSKEFFDGLKQLAIKSGVLINAKLNEEIIGATVFFKSKDYSHYFLSSANEVGRRNAVSNLMLHHGAIWAKEQGAGQMHIGGGVTAELNDPLLSFKKSFSKKTVKFYIGKRIHNASAYEEIVAAWDKENPEYSMKYKSILQRYRFTKEELS